MRRKWKWLCPLKDYTPQDPDDEDEVYFMKMDSEPYEFSKAWLENMDIYNWFEDLKKWKCQPALRLLPNKKWRVSINVLTDMCEDSPDINVAFRKAFRKWVKAGMPTASSGALVLHVKESKDGGRILRELAWRIV